MSVMAGVTLTRLIELRKAAKVDSRAIYLASRKDRYNTITRNI